MKELSSFQMEKTEGGDLDFWGGFACGGAILAGGAVLAGTGGGAAPVALFIASQGCAHYIGYSLTH